jgi:hypothetical protein
LQQQIILLAAAPAQLTSVIRDHLTTATEVQLTSAAANNITSNKGTDLCNSRESY